MRWLVVSVVILAADGLAAQDGDKGDKAVTFQVESIQIDIDKKLRDSWQFSGFQVTKSPVDLTIRGIAVSRGGSLSLDRWYAYDKDEVIIEQGPLGYQDYPVGEKTRFEMLLGEQWRQVKRIRIAGPARPSVPSVPTPPAKRSLQR